jgi:class 3 adenylate cyclase
VEMALEMQGEIAALGSRWAAAGFDQVFRVRMGINTGVASVGNFGSKGRVDYTAIGRQVNLAARLQASCEPGRILISHSTWLLVRDDIECTPREEITVKGARNPVRTYEVVGLAAPSL